MTDKILVIDDEPDMLKLLTMILRDRVSYEVTTTNNPVEGVEFIRRGGFDLLITDLKMPGMDGEELLNVVKQNCEDVPVIIITAFSTVDSALKLIKKGAFDYITKPFRKEQILSSIDKALKYSKLQQENKALREQLKREGN